MFKGVFKNIWFCNDHLLSIGNQKNLIFSRNQNFFGEINLVCFPSVLFPMTKIFSDFVSTFFSAIYSRSNQRAFGLLIFVFSVLT